MKAWACAPFVIILVLVYGLEEEGVLAIFCWKLCVIFIFVWYNERDYTLVLRNWILWTFTSSCIGRIKKIYGTKRGKNIKVIELGDQGNMVDENITEVQLRNFIKERQIQKDVIETTIEVAAEELLAAQRTFENKIECRALLEALCEIENEIKELSNRLKPLIRDDAEFRNVH